MHRHTNSTILQRILPQHVNITLVFLGQICTAHAQKLLFPSFRSKFWHRQQGRTGVKKATGNTQLQGPFPCSALPSPPSSFFSSLSFPALPFHSPPRSGAPNPARVLWGALWAPPAGSGAKPRPQTHLVTTISIWKWQRPCYNLSFTKAKKVRAKCLQQFKLHDCLACHNFNALFNVNFFLYFVHPWPRTFYKGSAFGVPATGAN